MPFRQGARLTIENLGEQEARLYFQIDYTLTEIPEDAAYFHAQWRRSNPLPTRRSTRSSTGSPGARTTSAPTWPGVNNSGWWGEGRSSSTSTATGVADDLRDRDGGLLRQGLELRRAGRGLHPFSTPFLGLNQVLKPDGLYRSQQRFGMYRWHVMDPIPSPPPCA